MSRPSYLWRKLTTQQCEELMAWRKHNGLPWHRPPHRSRDKNYVHNNPVHHRYVREWQDWPFSSAQEYLAEMGRAEAARLWKEYPLLGYGKGWDDAEL